MMWKWQKQLLLLCLLFVLQSLQTTQPTKTYAISNLQQTIYDSTLIYYRIDDPNDQGKDQCGGNPSISLGNFIKKTLPNEWIESWGNVSNGDEALKAGAIAIRSWVLSPANSQVYPVNGQDYFCVDVRFDRLQFDPAENINDYPNSVAAVNATNGIIMTHPNAPLLLGLRAIDAQFRDETGENTWPGTEPWLESIYDPISAGETPAWNPQGMGAWGSKRWAWGQDDSGQAFPKWDYRRILAHYYTGIEFIGITNPDPPESLRANMLKIEGIPADGLTMCKGDRRTGIRVLYQNTGRGNWPVNGVNTQGQCVDPVPDYYTLLGHHVVNNPSGIPACGNASNCVGVRRSPMCRANMIEPGEHFWVNGFEIWIPDDPAIIEGNTYLFRFDIEHRYNFDYQGQIVPYHVWNGYPNYDWPAQDIPVTICNDGPPPGGPTVGVRIQDYPPAVVSYNDLDQGYFRFSWEGINEPDGYDLQYRSKQNTEANYPPDFNAPPLLQNMNPAITEVPLPVDCNSDRRNWQFRVRADKAGQPSSDWAYVEAQTRVYPHPWPWPSNGLSGLHLNSDLGPWSAIARVINYGGGVFDWSVTSNQPWIEIVNSSGQGEGSINLVIHKPAGGSGDYHGNITVTTSNPIPSPSCNPNATFSIPITLAIRDVLFYQYLPIIFKNSP